MSSTSCSRSRLGRSMFAPTRYAQLPTGTTTRAVRGSVSMRSAGSATLHAVASVRLCTNRLSCFQCLGGPPLGVDFDQRELNRQSYSLAEAYVIAVCTFDGARGKHDLFECCVCHGYSCLTRCAEGVVPCSRLVVDDRRGPDRDWDSECPGRRIFCLDCARTHASLCLQCLQNFCAECLRDNGGVCPKCGTVCDGSLNHWQ